MTAPPAAPHSPDAAAENVRLAVLASYDILDTPTEAEFDDFTLLAAQICRTPIALVSLVDAERQWFKSRLGLELAETCRSASFCAHALQRASVLVVPDALEDLRFADNPLVTGGPGIRFYAGAPLLSAGGHALGTLCVIDRAPRTLAPEQLAALEALSRQVVARLELRRGLAERARAEESLRESEARKAAILRSALDCIITMDARGRIAEWNPAAESAFGHSAADAVGKDLADLIVPAALRDAHRRGLAHYLGTGEGPVLGRRIEITGRRADGAEFPVELAIAPIRLESGVLFTATLRDISARKEAEGVLRDREEQYRRLFEGATHGIYRTTPDGRILLANPALLSMLGYDSFGQLAGRNLESGGIEAAYARADFRARLEAEGEVRGLETTWQCRDGRTIFVRENAHLVRDAEGVVLFYEGSVEDVTARKEAEEALRQAHDALEARVEARTRDLDRLRRHTESLLLAAGEGIYGIDADGLTTFVNPAAARMLGRDSSELTGLSMHALMHHTRADGSPYPHDECPMRTTLTDGQTYHVDDEVFWRRDGTCFPVEYIVTPIRAEGGRSGAVITFQDISARRQAEAALAETGARLQVIMDNIPQRIFWKGADSVYQGCNRNFARALGLEGPADVAGRTDYDLLPDRADADRFRAADRRVMDGGGPELRVISHMTRVDGSLSWAETNKIPLQDAAGRITGVLGTFEDVSARRQAEEALAGANRALSAETAERQSIMEAVPDILFRLDLAGRLTRWNRKMEAVTGLTAGELQDRDALSLFPPEERAAVGAAIGLAFAAGHAEVEAHLLSQTGEPVPHQFSGGPMRDAEGRVVGLSGMGRDITTLRREQAALAQSEQRYRSLVEHSPEGIVVYSGSRLVYLNRAALRLLGADAPEQLLGRPVLDVVHPDWREQARERAVLSQRQGRASALAEFKYLRVDGSAIDVEAVSTPILFEGEPAGQVLIRDITGRKRAEEEIYRLHGELTLAYDQALNAYDATIEGWSRALDLRDHETEGHSRRVTEMSLRLARALGVGEAEIVHLRRGALLHDIGKMGVPDSVLLKPGPLTDGEWTLMRRHPDLAREMLAPVDFLRPALDIPWRHHEKWDGTGYPGGLSGEDIPRAARLFALVDVWDALSSDRPYRRAWPPGRVLDHLRGLSGTHFDPRVVDAFLRLTGAADAPRPAPLARAA